MIKTKIILNLDYDFFTRPILEGDIFATNTRKKSKTHQKESKIWNEGLNQFWNIFNFKRCKSVFVSLDHDSFIKFYDDKIIKDIGFDSAKTAVLSLDAHHDLYVPKMANKVSPENLEIGLANYYLWLIHKKHIKNLTWVMPPDVKDSSLNHLDNINKVLSFEKESKYRFKINNSCLLETIRFEELVGKKIDVDEFFICYSPFFSQNDTKTFLQIIRDIEKRSNIKRTVI